MIASRTCFPPLSISATFEWISVTETGDFGDARRDGLESLRGRFAGAYGSLDPLGDLGDGPRDATRALARGLRKLADLIGDDREALARLARMGRLNGGVHGEKVGLLRDAPDDRGHLLDHVHAVRDPRDTVEGFLEDRPSLLGYGDEAGSEGPVSLRDARDVPDGREHLRHRGGGIRDQAGLALDLGEEAGEGLAGRDDGILGAAPQAVHLAHPLRDRFRARANLFRRAHRGLDHRAEPREEVTVRVRCLADPRVEAREDLEERIEAPGEVAELVTGAGDEAYREVAGRKGGDLPREPLDGGGDARGDADGEGKGARDDEDGGRKAEEEGPRLEARDAFVDEGVLGLDGLVADVDDLRKLAGFLGQRHEGEDKIRGRAPVRTREGPEIEWREVLGTDRSDEIPVGSAEGREAFSRHAAYVGHDPDRIGLVGAKGGDGLEGLDGFHGGDNPGSRGLEAGLLAQGRTEKEAVRLEAQVGKGLRSGQQGLAFGLEPLDRAADGRPGGQGETLKDHDAEDQEYKLGSDFRDRH